MIVVSDTHGSFRALRDLAERQHGHCDLLLHLGDGEREAAALAKLFPDLPVRAVRGNCDFAGIAPADDFLIADGIGVFFAHGHAHNVTASLDALADDARRRGAAVALYGHTHAQRSVVLDDGLLVMNPGSLARPRDGAPGYGILEIANGTAQCRLVRL